jgi:hypothetical protein
MSDSSKIKPQDAQSQREAYLRLLYETLQDPVHKRLVAAYSKGSEPVASMETELGLILNELIVDEN